MPIRNDLNQVRETIGEFELAAEARFQEGSDLVLHSKTRYAGVYILGYSAEMFLKCSVFRFMSMKTDDLIRDCLTDKDRYLKKNQILPQAPHENNHSLRYWSEILLKMRDWEDKRLVKTLETDLLFHSEAIYDNWWVEMRYKSIEIKGADTETMRQSCAWMSYHYDRLWR